jgi:hypothetical protein
MEFLGVIVHDFDFLLYLIHENVKLSISMF